MGVCPKCQQSFEAGVTFCPNDGNRITQDASPSQLALAKAGMPPLPPAPEPGWVIDGKYRLEKKLGEGGMGSVWRAVHDFMNKPVALKLLRPQIASSEEAVKRFAREAKLCSQIDEPHCVMLYDCGKDPKSGTLYLAMEYLEGRSLRALIDAERRVPVPQAIQILSQLLSALGAAHERGIVHRDVKPENIFLVSHGKRKDFVKLLDFGIAKQPPQGDYKTQITRAGFTVGTPEYISPEQAFAKEVDGRSDLYAAGVIFFELIVGRRPFVGENALIVITAHVQQAPPSPRQLAPDANIPEAVEKIVLKALAKEPQDRYQDADQFKGALQEALFTIAPALATTMLAPDIVFSPPPAAMKAAAKAPELNTMSTRAQPLPAAPGWMRPAFYGLAGLSGLLVLWVLILLLQSPANAQPPAAPIMPIPNAKVEDALKQAKTAAKKGQWKEARNQLAIARAASSKAPVDEELIDLAIEAIIKKKDEADARALIVQDYNKDAIPVLRKALQEPARRIIVVGVLGDFLPEEPQVVGVLANALGSSEDCEDRLRLVRALSRAPDNNQTAIDMLKTEKKRAEGSAPCKANDLSKEIDKALKNVGG